MERPVCPGQGLWNDHKLNTKTCMCEPRTPTPTPPPSPKKSSPVKSNSKKNSPKKEKSKNCTKRNPSADKDEYCNIKQPYYHNGCCYKGKKSTSYPYVIREYRIKGSESPKSIKNKQRKSKTLKKKDKIIIKDTTPEVDKMLSKTIKNSLINVTDKTILTRGQVIKSFTPYANRNLQSVNRNNKKRAVVSSIATPLIKDLASKDRGTNPVNDRRYAIIEEEVEYLLQKPYVYDDTGKKHDFNTKKAVEILLNNLYSTKKLDYTKVIAPIQWHSNCWFNCGFMINFISDKGNKFNKFIREAMITGSITTTKDKSQLSKPLHFLDKSKNVVRKKINPPSLRKALFVLNLAIESAITGTQLAYFFDTNMIVRQIYQSLPSKFKAKNPIIKTAMPGNPSAYYSSIISYLIEDKSDIPIHTDNWYIESNSDIIENIDIMSSWTSSMGKKPSDIIKLSIYDDNVKENPGMNPGESKYVNNKPYKITIDDKEGNIYEYELDSILIRDKSARHFACVIMCGGVECGFDGESFHRMSKFNWKKLINKDQNFTFEGSNVYWNFMNGYQELNYYRIK